MAECLTPEQLTEIRARAQAFSGIVPPSGNLRNQAKDLQALLAHIDSQQVEIDCLLKANDYLRGQIFRGPDACYCVCHNPLSSCGYCQHCKGDNSVGEFHRLRALLGEARDDIVQASEHLRSFPHTSNCDAIHLAFGIMRRLLAKLAQEADRG